MIAGSARGRRLVAPRGSGTRPTADRVREAVFNALGSLGAVDEARVLDLFAGTGAMGIEALSRGALNATFVESSRDVTRVIQSNLDATGFSERAEVVASDVSDFLRTTREDFDLVFADPPYAFDAWQELQTSIERVAPGGIIVIESDRPIETGGHWSVIRERRYGSTLVTVFEIPTERRERS